MKINKPAFVAGIRIPDSTIAKQATELLLEHGSAFLYNHSLRSFCFASLNGTQEKISFKKNIIPAFFEGFKHKTDTTYGSINADICAYMIPNFQRKDFCDAILNSPWSE